MKAAPIGIIGHRATRQGTMEVAPIDPTLDRTRPVSFSRQQSFLADGFVLPVSSGNYRADLGGQLVRVTPVASCDIGTLD
jgi:hypothetical protein